MSIIDVDK